MSAQFESPVSETPDYRLSRKSRAKLEYLKSKLGAGNLDEALEKSLSIANFVANVVNDPDRKLLIERDGKYMQLKAIS